MVTPTEIGNIIGQGWASVGQVLIINTIKYIIFFAVVAVVGYIIYYTISFPIRAIVFPLYGSSSNGVFNIGKPKNNRVKWIKHKTAWAKMKPFMNHKEIEPFDSEFIYPGNVVYAFELNGEWIPGRINVSKADSTLAAEISPVPYYIRNWQSLQHKRNALEFSGNNFWDENRALFVGLIVSVGCLVAVCVTIYLTYQHIDKMIPVLKSLTSSITQSNTIPGTPPPG